MVNHVNRYHVAAGDYPGQGWLRLHRCWVCTQCQALHFLSRPAPTSDCTPAPKSPLPSPWVPAEVTEDLPSPGPRVTAASGETGLDADWKGLPLLQEILSSHRPLLRHVPRGCHQVWGSGLAHAINRLLRDRTWESFAALCAYPKITLSIPHRGGQGRWDQAREVRRRVHAFSDGAWLDLWKATGAGMRSNPRRGRKRPADEGTESTPSRVQDKGFLNSLQGMMEDGAFGKAAKHLLSAGLHDPTDPGSPSAPAPSGHQRWPGCPRTSAAVAYGW